MVKIKEPIDYARLSPQEWSALSEDERANVPWDTKCMIVAKGRYYWGHYFMGLPKTILTPQGDITGMLWRYDDKPDEWIFTSRLRLYVDGKAFDSDDRKIWRVEKFTGSGEDIAARIAARIQYNATGDAADASWIVIKGDQEKFGEAIKKASEDGKHPYLHIKVEPKPKN